MANMIYRKVNYINWKYEAKHIMLSNDDMKEKLNTVRATRKETNFNTKRSEFTETTYKTDIHGDYAELYLLENGEYKVYCNNMRDNAKNVERKRLSADKLFQAKFKELNGCGLQHAFDFVDKSFKRCIPKQFVYVNEKYCNKKINMSSIDASSQYPSGCLGKLPDFHTAIKFDHRVEPNEEYPFAFYASGHLAIYNELDTHEWFGHKLWKYLFRIDPHEDWPFRPLPKDKEETILMKASQYTMDETWQYFYNIKKTFAKDSEDYNNAKLVMNTTIGQWHRKDKDKKRIMSYDDGGSFRLAHIVAVAIARGNQKILNKIEEIGLERIAHICVDGIIYIGDTVYGVPESSLGVFNQEFVNKPTVIKGINVYCVRDSQCVKFRHAGFDLIDGQEIDESRDFTFEDLDKLGIKDRVGDMIRNG